jgi:hypothetical protein
VRKHFFTDVCVFPSASEELSMHKLLGRAQWPIPVSKTISQSRIDSLRQAIWFFLCFSLYRQLACN